MKGLAKTLAGALAMAACLLTFGSDVFAGTGLYVGKDVSAEGTTLLGVSTEFELGMSSVPVILEKGLMKKGDVIKGDNGYEYTLPEDSAKMTLVRLMSYVGYGDWNCCATNEYGVSVMANITTDSNVEAVLADPFVEDGICEQKMATVLAANSKSAKEAAMLLCSIIEEKGADSAEIVFIADPEGAWVVENFTGHQYVATKLPDDVMATFGNEPIIKTADPDDENTICSSDLFKLPEENGFAIYSDDDSLDLILTYNDSNMYSDEPHLRGWIGHDIFAASEELDYDAEDGYDVFFKPDEKVSIKQAFAFYRNRFEGTAFDLADSDNDYYWGINNQAVGNADIIQIFDDVPAEMSTVIWNTPANPTASPFLPLPALADEIPESYTTDSEDASFDDGLLQFDFAKLNTKVVPRRNLYGKSIRHYWEGMEAVSADDVVSSTRGKWKDEFDASSVKAVSVINEYVEMIVDSADENCNRLSDELEWYLFRNGVRKSTVDDDELEPFECSFDAVSYAHVNGWDTLLDGDVFTATKDGRKIEVIIGGDNEGQVTFTGFDNDKLADDFNSESGEPDENGLTDEEKAEEAEAAEETVEEEIKEAEDSAGENEDAAAEEKAEDTSDDETTEEVVKAAAAQVEVDTIAELEEYFGEKIAAIPRDGWAENEIAKQLADVSNGVVEIIGRHFDGDIDIDRLISEDYYKVGNDIVSDPDLATAGDRMVAAGLDLSALAEKYFTSLYEDVSGDIYNGRLTQEGAVKILTEAEGNIEGIATLYLEGITGTFGEIFNTDLSEEELAEILTELGEGTIQVMDDYDVIDRSALGLEDIDIKDLSEADINVVITLDKMDDDVLAGLSDLLGVDVRATIDMYMDAINASSPNLTVVEAGREIKKTVPASDEKDTTDKKETEKAEAVEETAKEEIKEAEEPAAETEDTAADEVSEEPAEEPAEEATEEPAKDTADDKEVKEATKEVVKAAAAKVEVDTIAELEEYFGEKIAAIPRDGWAENEIAKQLADVSDDVARIIGRHFDGDIDIDRLISEDYYKVGNDIVSDPDLATAGDKMVAAGLDLSALAEKYFSSLYEDVSGDIHNGRLTQEGAVKILTEAEGNIEGIATLYLEGVAGTFGEVFNTDLTEEELAEILTELGEGTIQLMEDYGVIDRAALGLDDIDIKDLTEADINVVITLDKMDDSVLAGLSDLLGVDVRATIDMYMDAINASSPNLTVVEEGHEIKKAQSAPDEKVMAAIELEESLSEDDIVIPQEVIDILNEAIAEAQNGSGDEAEVKTAEAADEADEASAEEAAPEAAADEKPAAETVSAADGGQFSVSLGKIKSANGKVMLPTYMLKYFN